MRDIKFISYNGKYPNLCSGTLILEVDGKQIVISNGALYSNGTAFIGDDGDEVVTSGPWSLGYGFDSSDFTRKELDYITKLVNDNVEEGCCGGCI